MKKLFICLIALVGLCSCESYLDKEEDTELTIDQFSTIGYLPSAGLAESIPVFPIHIGDG